jgi:hypothetical protein
MRRELDRELKSEKQASEIPRDLHGNAGRIFFLA